ncbi:MAG: tRNA dihydrouridine synthase DusB [Candidatus Latescibacteria bacterium]|nr:tRNA dihydrouridine synthase DusB [Candidatus Latescibacterota bacterium]
MSRSAPLTIGPVRVSPGLLLAPMEDVTDLPFRSLCRRLGADIVYTEFVNAEGLIRHARRAHQKLEFLEEERPLGIQLYGATELSMEQAARIATDQNPDLIDINCGCWVSDVALRGAGAGLLRDLPRMREVVARVVRSTHLPVTVKTRLGWDTGSIRIVEVARMLEDLGVRALTIHCRTRAQGHQGTVDYAWIPQVKEAVAMPVILNGDVVTPRDVERAFAETGCDGVMIGRGAIQNPWIFRQTRHYLDTGQLLPDPSLAERATLCLEHLHLAVARKGGSAALAGLRRHFSGYFRGLPGASGLRGELAALKEAAQVEQRLLVLAEQTDSLAA